MSTFEAQRAPLRAQPRQRGAREIGAAVRWLVWGMGPWGDREESLPVMVGRIGVMVGAWILRVRYLRARARRRAECKHEQNVNLLAYENSGPHNSKIALNT